MILTNTEEIPGYQIEKIIGVVNGNIVQSKHVGRDIMAGLKTIVGGEIGGYTELLTDAREEAQIRMLDNARKLGADAVINIRYTSSTIGQGMSEILVYGTAVKASEI